LYCNSWIIKDQLDVTSYVLNMFRTLIYPISGACDCAVELPHRSFCSRFVVCWKFGAAGLECSPCCRRCVLEIWCGWVWVLSVLQAEACNTDSTQTQPHQISNTQRTENKTTDVVIQQHSRKLLMMDILKSETCWAHKKWNKIASDIKLVFYSQLSVLIVWLPSHRHTQYRGTMSKLNIFKFTHSPLHLLCVCLYSADTVDAGIRQFVNIFQYVLSVIFIAPTISSLCSFGIWYRFRSGL